MTSRRSANIAGRSAGLFALVLAVGACGQSDRVAGPGDLSHIHDLAFDESGQVLAASHTGLYRIESLDRAVLVGADQHDLMSMSRSFNGDLLASGHPDLRVERYRVDGRPPFFGLATSTDNGETWAAPDLLGDADFHALVPHQDGLFAADTQGQIWVLKPGQEWKRLGEVEARDLAIDPSDSSRQLAPDWDGGVWISEDGGRTWELLEEVPALVEIEWSNNGTRIGVDESGQFWENSDDGSGLGQLWTQTSSGPTEVETFYLQSANEETQTWWITVKGGQIWRSTDAGDNWTQVYDPPR